MLTTKQQKWVDHLSDVHKIQIFPFDPKSSEKFQKIKKKIQSIFGPEIKVLHRGASSFGISGQAEIDVYIPVKVEKMDEMASEMEKFFGKTKSIYPKERIKFYSFTDKTKLEIMITNESCKSWTDGELFYEYLIKNKKTLEKYRKLKEGGNSLSVREYYRRKIEFINDILSKIKQSKF